MPVTSSGRSGRETDKTEHLKNAQSSDRVTKELKMATQDRTLRLSEFWVSGTRLFAWPGRQTVLF